MDRTRKDPVLQVTIFVARALLCRGSRQNLPRIRILIPRYHKLLQDVSWLHVAEGKKEPRISQRTLHL